MMIEMWNQGEKILEMIRVYGGAGIYYVLQTTSLEQYEIAVNILVGLLVALYTLTKIVDWGWKKEKARRERNRIKKDEDNV